MSHGPAAQCAGATLNCRNQWELSETFAAIQQKNLMSVESMVKKKKENIRLCILYLCTIFLQIHFGRVCGWGAF